LVSRPANEWKIGSSAGGTPSSPQITPTGRGYATADTTSSCPGASPASVSNNPVTSVSMCGRMPRIRGANWCIVCSRSVLWCGGSRNRNGPATWLPSEPNGESLVSTLGCCTLILGSRSSRVISSCVLTTHSPASSRWIGVRPSSVKNG
jgi:hypothetical protein